MPNFGVVLTGFNVKPLDQIKLDIENRLKASVNFGNSIDTSAGSSFGQLIGAHSVEAANLWERFDEFYNQQSILNATEVNLDLLVAINSIIRLEATSTTVNEGLAGTPLTVVPALTQIKNNITNELFELVNDTVITNLQLDQIFVTIDTVIDSTLYTLDVGGVPYTYTTAGSGDTADIIATALTAALNADGGRVADGTPLLGGRIQLDGIPSGTPFDTIVDANMTFYTPSVFTSINTGAILAVANTVDIIETPVVGLASVNNFIDGFKGREDETDEELRTRFLESLQIIGAGTLESIISRVKNDADIGATSVTGFENVDDVVDLEGRPAHSFEIVILSADTTANDNLIAALIWLIKPAGIKTFGNDSGTTTDSNGDPQVINFSRPTSILAHVKITYVVDTETPFPSDGVDTIKQCVLDVGNDYDIGENLKPLDFAQCVSAFPGVESAVIEVAIGGAPVFTTNVINIDDNDEIAVFDLTRITVTT
ncbi:MAG: hypothetical protein V3V00_15955 [Saprospiraceae bacterium]